MIIWKGFGFLVAVIGFGSLVLADLLSARISGNPDFYRQHGWVILLGMLVAAGLTYGLHRLLQLRKRRVVVDKTTSEEFVLAGDDSLFFVPVRWWPGVFILLGIALAVAGPHLNTKPGAGANGNGVAGQQ